MSLKLLGFASWEETDGADRLARTIHSELVAARNLLGSNIATLACARTRTDLLFLRTCIELRIPTIVFLPDNGLFRNDPDSTSLLETLLSVSLAHYAISADQGHSPILEWSDALLCMGACADQTFIADAIAMGIPLRLMDVARAWTPPPLPDSAPKHGFATRRDLLDFLDRRFFR